MQKEINFSLHRSEDWLITGKNGAGKSSFMQLLRGDLWPLPGNNGKPRLYFPDGQASVSPLPFKEQTAWISPGLPDLYRGKKWDLSVHEILVSGLYQSFLLYEAVPESYWEQAAQQAEQFGIKRLLSRKIFRLSQGEAQKALVARALMNSPAVLFVDEIGPNLDQRSKAEIRDILRLARSKGTQLVVAAHYRDEITREIPNSVLLEQGHILFQGQRATRRESQSKDTKRRSIVLKSRENRVVQNPEQDGNHSPAIRINEVSVRIQGRTILENLSWSINPGEHWGVTGPNGSGKSTLLRLILGEIHPVPGDRIIRFGRKDNWSIWELKKTDRLFSSGTAKSTHLQSDRAGNACLRFQRTSGFFCPGRGPPGRKGPGLARNLFHCGPSRSRNPDPVLGAVAPDSAFEGGDP